MKNGKQLKIYITYLLMGITTSIATVGLPLILIAKQLSDDKLAFILSVSFLGALFQPIFGSISDHVKHPKYVISTLCFIMSITSIILLYASNYYVIMILVLIISICSISTLVLFDGLISFVAHKYEYNYGFLRSAGSLGYGSGLFLSLPFIYFGSNLSLVIALSFFSILSGLICLKISEVIVKSGNHHYFTEIKKLSKSKLFLVVLITSVLVNGLNGIKISYQTVLLQDLGATIVFISVVSFFTIIPEILFMPKYDKWFGDRKFSTILLASNTIFILQNLIYYFTDNQYIILFVAAFHGLGMAIFIPASTKVLRALLAPEILSTGFLLRSTVTSIVSFAIGSTLIATFYNDFGVNSVFIIIVVISTLSYMPILYLRYKL